jgi:integrase
MQGSIRKIVGKTGVTYSYRFDIGIIDGKRKQIEKGGFKQKSTCESAMRKAMSDYENNFILPDQKLTLDDIVQNFIVHTETTKKLNTFERYRSIYEGHIKKGLGSLKAMKVSPESLEKLFNDKKDLSGSTLQLIYTVINSSFDRAIKQKKLNDNPCKYIERPQRKKKSSDVLTVDEVLNVLNELNINQYNDYIMFLAINICVELGLRRGELAALQWKHIDNNKKTIKVEDNLVYISGHTYLNDDDLKTESSTRTLPVSDALLTLLDQHRKKQLTNQLICGQDYVKNEYNNEFKNFVMTWENGKVVHPNYYTMRIKKIMQELGIEKNIRFHDLRHTNATLLIQQQVDFKTLQKRLGHADFSTTMNIYAHVTEDMQRDATDKISSLIHKIK